MKSGSFPVQGTDLVIGHKFQQQGVVPIYFAQIGFPLQKAGFQGKTVLFLPLTCGPCQAMSIEAKIHSMKEGKLEKKKQKNENKKVNPLLYQRHPLQTYKRLNVPMFAVFQ